VSSSMLRICDSVTPASRNMGTIVVST
jgi:hypothetical protein